MAGESAHGGRGGGWRWNRPEVLLAGGVCEDDVPSVRARHREGARRRSLAIWVDQIWLAAPVPFPLYSTTLHACNMLCPLSLATWLSHGYGTASCRGLRQGTILRALEA